MTGVDWQPSGTPVVFVNPDDVNLPAVKHQAALRGADVIASAAVPPGKAFYAPQGLLRPVPHPDDE